jgi:hypothetical protein
MLFSNIVMYVRQDWALNVEELIFTVFAKLVAMVFVWKHTGCTECAMNWQVFVCLSQKFLFCYLIEQVVIKRTKKWNVKSTFFGKGGSWFLSNLNQSDFETDLRTPRHSVNSSFVRQLARLANVYYLYIGTNNPHSVSWLLYHRICFCWLALRQVDWMSWHRFYTYVVWCQGTMSP